MCLFVSSITPFSAVNVTLQQHWRCPDHLHNSSHLWHLGRRTNLSVKRPCHCTFCRVSAIFVWTPFCVSRSLLWSRQCVTLHAPLHRWRPPQPLYIMHCTVLRCSTGELQFVLCKLCYKILHCNKSICNLYTANYITTYCSAANRLATCTVQAVIQSIVLQHSWCATCTVTRAAVQHFVTWNLLCNLRCTVLR